MTARIAAAQPPFPEDMQAALDAVMRGRPPLVLFTTMARDPRLFRKFFSSGLLDRGHLSIREREIVIDRTTALCGSEYEWGVHITAFAERAGLNAEQVRSFTAAGSQDSCWTPVEKLLLRLCESLHTTCSIDDEIWTSLREHFSEEAMLELLMLAGFYRTVSYLTNALHLPLETSAARFPTTDQQRMAPSLT